MNEDEDRDILTIIYMMARSDGLSKEEAEEAVHKHNETGCGYNFRRPRQYVTHSAEQNK